jgi:heme a synthase
MTLGEFQVHLLVGMGPPAAGPADRAGLGGGVPVVLAARADPAGWTGRLLGLGALGGLQGAIGWWMVASGLEEGMVAVASYRLAVHLGLAFVILGLIAWYVMLLGRRQADLMQARAGARRGCSAVHGADAFAFLQILLGALVAGIDAGRGYTDWPLMAGGIFPPGHWELQPVWRNFFENDGTWCSSSTAWPAICWRLRARRLAARAAQPASVRGRSTLGWG